MRGLGAGWVWWKWCWGECIYELGRVQDENSSPCERRERSRTSKYGGKGSFLSGINKRVGELGVGERISRGRVGYEKDIG